MITQERLKELLNYSPETGLFTWKVNKGSRGKVGAIAGNKNKITGYVLIVIDTKSHLAHRLAFLYMAGSLPSIHTDHINGVRDDNKWDNLREVTAEQNHRNRRKHKSNTSGVTGIRWSKASNKWLAEIRFNYVLRHLGLFTDRFDAICARKSAELRLGFHKNHGI